MQQQQQGKQPQTKMETVEIGGQCVDTCKNGQGTLLWVSKLT